MPRKKAIDLKEKIHWGESYTSLILGIVVVVLVGLLTLSFLKNRHTGEVSSTKTVNEQSSKSQSHIVQAGEDLWSISEKIYKSGYYWSDIAKVNNLSDPGLINPGDKLMLPSQKTSPLADIMESQKITDSSYTVVEGDTLWDISVRAYGDGYKWVEIAQVNNWENPDLIYPGNVFKIPR